MQTPTAGTQHPGPAAGKQHQSHSSCCLTFLFFFSYLLSLVEHNLCCCCFFIYLFLLILLHNTLQLPDEEAQPRAHGAVSSTRSSLWQRSVHLQIIHCLQITHKKHEFIYYASTQKDHAPRVPSRNAKACDG